MSDYTARSSVILNGKSAEDQLERLSKKATALRDDMKKLRQANDLAGFKEKEKELKLVNKEMRQMRKEAFSVDNVLKNLSTASFKQIATAARKAHNELKQMAQTDPGYARKAAQVKNLNSKLRELQANSKAQNSMWGRMADGFNRYFAMATAWIASVTGVVMGMKRMKGTLDDFEETMTNVYTLMDEADYEAFKNMLDEGSVQLLRQYGFEISDINKALFDTISAGVPAGESIQFMNEAAVLAKGGVTSLSTSVDGMTSIINAYGLSIDQVNEVSSAFFTAQKYGKTTVEALASSIGTAVPIAAQAGVSYRELLSATAALTTQGISTDMAMTAMKNALQSLLKPGKEAEAVLTQLGVPVGATQVRTKGLAYSLEKLNKAMLENPDAVSKAIPNIRGLTAVSALSGRGLEKYHEILQKVNTDFGEGSSLMNAYTKQMETNVAKQQARMGELKATILELGDELRPVFTDAIRLSNWGFKTLLKLVKVIIDNKGAIYTLTAGVTAYWLALKATNISLKENLLLTKAKNLWTKTVTAANYLAATAQAKLTGNTVRANIAMKAFNKTVKLNPIVFFVSLLATAGVAIYQYTRNVDSAKGKQKEFNQELEESNRLLTSSKTIEERAGILKNLSDTQLDALQNDIKTQLDAEDDFHAKLLVKLKNTLKEDVDLRNMYAQLRNENLTEEQRERISIAIGARRVQLARELEEENQASKQRITNYKKYLADIDKEKSGRENKTGTPEETDALSALELANKQRTLKLKEQYGLEENMQKFLHARLLANELAYLQAKEQLETDLGKKLDLQIKIVDVQYKYNRAIKAAVDPLRLNEKAVEKLNTKLLEEEKLLKRNSFVAKQASNDQKELTNTLVDQANVYQNTIHVISDGLFDMMSGSENAFKTFAKNILIFALEQLKVQTQLAVAGVTIQSLAQPDSILTFGASGLARAALIVGLIEAAFAGIEGLVNNAFSGGANEYAKGKYPDMEFAGRPNTGMYGSRPQLGIFNEVPGQPEMVIDGVTTRNIQVNYPEIAEAIYAVRDGRQPQMFAEGKYPDNPRKEVSNPTQPYTDSSNNTILENLTVAIYMLMKHRPQADLNITEVKKELNNLAQREKDMGM